MDLDFICTLRHKDHVLQSSVSSSKTLPWTRLNKSTHKLVQQRNAEQNLCHLKKIKYTVDKENLTCIFYRSAQINAFH